MQLFERSAGEFSALELLVMLDGLEHIARDERAEFNDLYWTFSQLNREHMSDAKRLIGHYNALAGYGLVPMYPPVMPFRPIVLLSHILVIAGFFYGFWTGVVLFVVSALIVLWRSKKCHLYMSQARESADRAFWQVSQFSSVVGGPANAINALKEAVEDQLRQLTVQERIAVRLEFSAND